MADDLSGGWRERSAEAQLEEEIENKRAQQRAEEREVRLRTALTRVQRLQDEMEAAELQTAEWNEAVDELHGAFVAAAIDWLAAKWGPQRPCPYCGNDEWRVSVPFNVLLESRETLAPHFSAMCTNCGNTVFVNAILAGLYPEPEQ